MLMTFDGPLRPLGAWLQAIFEARHAASTKFWAKAVERCHTIGDLRDVMARRVPPPTADYYFGGADDEITMGDNERAFQAVRLNPRMGVKFDDVNMKVTVSRRRDKHAGDSGACRKSQEPLAARRSGSGRGGL